MTEVYHGDLSPIASADLDHINAVSEKNIKKIPMQPGDVLLVDNYRILHGRDTFKGDRFHAVSWFRGLVKDRPDDFTEDSDGKPGTCTNDLLEESSVRWASCVKRPCVESSGPLRAVGVAKGAPPPRDSMRLRGAWLVSRYSPERKIRLCVCTFVCVCLFFVSGPSRFPHASPPVLHFNVAAPPAYNNAACAVPRVTLFDCVLLDASAGFV